MWIYPYCSFTTTLQLAQATLYEISNYCRVCSFIMFVTFHSRVTIGAISPSVISTHALISYIVNFILLFSHIGFITIWCVLISSWFSSSTCYLVRIRICSSAKFSTSKNCCDSPSHLILRLTFITQCSFFIFIS